MPDRGLVSSLAGAFLLAFGCGGAVAQDPDAAGAAGAAAGGRAGTSGSAGAPTAGAGNLGQRNCMTDFDKLDRSCSHASDCEIVQHQVDCCGTQRLMGLEKHAGIAFAALEQYCAAEFPACGCASHGYEIDNGTNVLDPKQAEVACEGGRCRSAAPAPRVCGDTFCTKGQYCSVFVGGPRGSVRTYDCQALGACQDCACLQPGLGELGCQCSPNAAGFITKYCAGP